MVCFFQIILLYLLRIVKLLFLRARTIGPWYSNLRRIRRRGRRNRRNTKSKKRKRRTSKKLFQFEQWKKRTGCLGHMGDEKLPAYVGITVHGITIGHDIYIYVRSGAGTIIKDEIRIPTVDGRNPAPPEMWETLQIMAYLPDQLVSRISEPWLFKSSWLGAGKSWKSEQFLMSNCRMHVWKEWQKKVIYNLPKGRVDFLFLCGYDDI